VQLHRLYADAVIFGDTRRAHAEKVGLQAEIRQSPSASGAGREIASLYGDGVLSAGGFFVVDGSDDLVGQFRRDACEAVIGASVVLGFFEHFFRGCAKGDEITIHTDVSTPENFCHFGLRPAGKGRRRMVRR
jgi:hypothetical protein